MKNIIAIFTVFTLILISASSFVIKGSDNMIKVSDEMIAPPQDDAAAKFPRGAKIYAEKCVACHQVTGEGIPGAFPPLKNSDYLLADKKRAVKQVLNGSNEPMTVNGATYNVPMPFQVDNHEDAVAVINYVLNSFGNNGGTVSLDEVKDIKIIR